LGISPRVKPGFLKKRRKYTFFFQLPPHFLLSAAMELALEFEESSYRSSSIMKKVYAKSLLPGPQNVTGWEQSL
jgi:hypothetical protein